YGFNDSVTNAFSSPAKAAMVFEADFVGGVITSSTKAKPNTGFNTFTWPSITPGANASGVEIGGDLFVTFRDTPAIEAFVKFLASPQAAEVWAKQGGFGTGNKNVPASVYPDAITRATEAPIGTAKSVVLDMSDQQPPSLGATPWVRSSSRLRSSCSACGWCIRPSTRSSAVSSARPGSSATGSGSTTTRPCSRRRR